jgi:peptide/nickel transport system ATP-binding protein
MSIVYITHDLTTAYQISDNIIVLYRGTVAEAGDVDLVVQSPKHPYTQLLINSVPEPDPDHAWGEFQVRGDVSDGSSGAVKVEVGGVLPTSAAASATARAHGGHLVQGCTFADRCPHVMDICRPNVPPLYRLDEARAASCFLYRDQGPAIASEQLNEVMAATDSTAYA